MKMEPTTISALRRELEQLSDHERLIERPGGMTEQKFLSLVNNITEDSLGLIEPLADAASHQSFELEHAKLGWEAFNRNEVAFCILAGDTGSQPDLGIRGLIRIPRLEMTTLSIQLASSRIAGWGKVFHPPVWIMTSPSFSSEPIKEHLSSLSFSNVATTFEQYESYALDPMGRLARDDGGMPLLRPTGTGDLSFALKASGLLDDFILRGGKHVIIVNVDNVLGGMDETILGYHISSGKDLTCEIVDRRKTDQGGLPAWIDGRLQMIEDSRLPDDIDPTGCRYLNTNNIIISASALADSVTRSFHYNRIRRIVDNGVITQYERLIHQLGEWYDLGVIHVPRHVRFAPIKTHADLQAASQRLQNDIGRPVL